MSFAEFEKDVLSGNLEHAYERAKDYVIGTLEPKTKAFAEKLMTDEGQVLIAAVEKQIPTVKADPLNSEVWLSAARVAFVEIGLDAPSIAIRDVYAYLNIAVEAA